MPFFEYFTYTHPSLPVWPSLVQAGDSCAMPVAKQMDQPDLGLA